MKTLFGICGLLVFLLAIVLCPDKTAKEMYIYLSIGAVVFCLFA